MATLSANSRRNSSTSNSSNPRSPDEFTPTEITTLVMQPVNEEEVVSEPIPLLPPAPISSPSHDEPIALKPIELPTISNENDAKSSKEKICTERSDSGFSDCSNSSNGNTMHAATNVAMTHPLFDKTNSISEEKSTNEPNQQENSTNNIRELGSKVSVNMLKMKLEKMAEAQQNTSEAFNTNKRVVKKLCTPFIIGGPTNINSKEMSYEEKISTEFMSMSYSYDLDDVNSLKEFDDQPKSLPIQQVTKSLMRSPSVHQTRLVEKEPIMKSDFTNTIKMRKKSLETNALREKPVHPQRLLLEPFGKVSKLLQRFDSQNHLVNGLHADCTSIAEPIVETPGIEDTLKEITVSESNKVDDEILHILGTDNLQKKSPAAAGQKTSIASRNILTKNAKPTTVNSGSGSMKPRAIATKQTTKTKAHVTHMEMKVTPQRKSPTKLTATNNNAWNAPINRDTLKAINNQTKHSTTINKSLNKYSAAKVDAGAGAVSAVQRTSRNITADSNTPAGSATTVATSKPTAHSSFRRTSPIRLSGRVKEVTSRLFMPKAIAKATSPVRDKKCMCPTTMAHAAINREHHQNEIAMKSGSSKIVTVTEAIIEQHVEQHVEHTINGKIDGTFTMKSKMNENFRKASAFWKAT